MMKGIKLAFVHNELPMDDLNYDGIYEVAREFGVPVYHHIGSSPLRKMKDFKTDDERKKYLRSSDPSALEWAIARHPDVPFILGHMGFECTILLKSTPTFISKSVLLVCPTMTPTAHSWMLL
jgi:predicted TIM-barrel fold metal-dependent hydrolase